MIWTKDCLKKIILTLTFGTLIAACEIEEPNSAKDLELVDETEIYNALVSEVGNVGIQHVRTNQYVKYEENYRVEIGDVYKTFELHRNVLDVLVDQPTKGKKSFTVFMTEDLYEFDEKGNIIDEKVGVELPPWTENFVEPSRLLQTSSTKTYKYFNLEVTKRDFPVPLNAKSRPDCGGFAGCKISGTKISYLKFVYENNRLKDRIQIDMTISKDIPPLLMGDTINATLPVLDLCTTRLYYDEVLGKVCFVLRDVQK